MRCLDGIVVESAVYRIEEGELKKIDGGELNAKHHEVAGLESPPPYIPAELWYRNVMFAVGLLDASRLRYKSRYELSDFLPFKSVHDPAVSFMHLLVAPDYSISAVTVLPELGTIVSIGADRLRAYRIPESAFAGFTRDGAVVWSDRELIVVSLKGVQRLSIPEDVYSVYAFPTDQIVILREKKVVLIQEGVKYEFGLRVRPTEVVPSDGGYVVLVGAKNRVQIVGKQYNIVKELDGPVYCATNGYLVLRSGLNLVAEPVVA